jgi:hypothetical protein
LILIFASWCLRYETPAAVIQHILTPEGTFRNVHRRRLLCLQEKNPSGNAENEIPIWYTPQHCVMKSAPAQFHCNFTLFFAYKVSA